MTDRLLDAVTAWRAFAELKDDGLAGAAPVKDERGTILEWRWHARPALADRKAA